MIGRLVHRSVEAYVLGCRIALLFLAAFLLIAFALWALVGAWQWMGWS